MTAPLGCQLIGRWRIVEADFWDRGYLGLVEPDEGDEASGGGSAELQDDRTIEIELSFDNGDDATLKACRQ